MKYLLQTLLDGLRAALLRAPRGRALLGGAGLFVALVATYLAASLVVDASEAAQPWRFNAGGVLVVLCDALLTYIAGWLLAYFAQRREVATGIACTLLAATIMVAVVVHWPLRHIADALQAHDHGMLALLCALLGQAWWFFVLLVVAHWLIPHAFGRALLASVLGYAELVRRRVDDASPLVGACDAIVQEAERMAEIVRKIGKITRYETKSYVGAAKIIDLDRSSEDDPNGVNR